MFWKADSMLNGWWKTRSAPYSCKSACLKLRTVVQVDNEASDDFTIVEVFTEDRIGVLFKITYTLHQSWFVDPCRQDIHQRRPGRRCFLRHRRNWGKNSTSRFDSKRFANPFTKV